MEITGADHFILGSSTQDTVTFQADVPVGADPLPTPPCIALTYAVNLPTTAPVGINSVKEVGDAAALMLLLLSLRVPLTLLMPRSSNSVLTLLSLIIDWVGTVNFNANELGVLGVDYSVMVSLALSPLASLQPQLLQTR